MRKLTRNGLILVVTLILALITQACGGGRTVAEVGARAPDFTLPNALGGEVSLDDYVGQRPVLLYFHMAVG